MTSRRRLTIGFIGNCQAELLQNAFARIAPAADFASFYHFFDIGEDRRAKAGDDLVGCDVVLMQDIQDLDAYPLREAIPAGAKILNFPFLRFASPWPFDDFNGLRDTVARNQDNPDLHTTTYYDGLLGRLRRTEPDPQARFEAYSTLDGAGTIDPARLHDFETRRLTGLDERFGIHIGRFIVDGFRNTQLFYTVNRPSGAVLTLLLQYILDLLEIDLAARDDGLDALGCIQVPVHPVVAARLGMQWAHARRRYRLGDRERTWEEFVRGYIERYG